MKKPKARPDLDAALFQSAVSDATPLAPRNRARLEKPRPKPVAGRHVRDGHADLDDRLSDHVPASVASRPGEALNFVRPGLQRQALRQLRKGGSAIQDELDLHGLTTAEARPLLVEFLNDCGRRGLRHVRIIHGKGLRSENREGVLKARVAGWLMQREDVLAFTQARLADGGSGAVVVLLRTSR